MRGNGRGNLISLPTPDARCQLKEVHHVHSVPTQETRQRPPPQIRRELAIVRLRPLAEDFSQEWAATVADRRPAPRPQPFIRYLAQHGFRLPTFIALHQYLERCRSDGKTPDCYNIIAALLSRIPGDQLGQLLQWVPLAPKSPRSGGSGAGSKGKPGRAIAS